MQSCCISWSCHIFTSKNYFVSFQVSNSSSHFGPKLMALFLILSLKKMGIIRVFTIFPSLILPSALHLGLCIHFCTIGEYPALCNSQQLWLSIQFACALDCLSVSTQGLCCGNYSFFSCIDIPLPFLTGFFQ